MGFVRSFLRVLGRTPLVIHAQQGSVMGHKGRLSNVVS
jgi:hypothetical protein